MSTSSTHLTVETWGRPVDAVVDDVRETLESVDPDRIGAERPLAGAEFSTP